MGYDNTNKGALFKNADKQEETHADYRGSINVNGEEFWLSAWTRTSAKGVKYMSLSVQPKNAGSAKTTRGEDKSDGDDSIPF